MGGKHIESKIMYSGSHSSKIAFTLAMNSIPIFDLKIEVPRRNGGSGANISVADF
jgi:hypothetical protein